jgi:acyl phosphate:glycerol-3-phosphate acyltransferase
MLENIISVASSSHIAVLTLGYLFGSIPFGLVITRFAGLGDIRKIGSGNLGATNVLRTGKKKLALLTLLLDAGKGGLVIVIVHYFFHDSGKESELSIFAGIAAVIGHNFPVWMRFQGGKGVATTLGTLLVIAWPVGLATCITWVIVAAISRYSSLSAIISLIASPFYALYLDREEVFVLASFLAILVIVRHHENIRKLITGREQKIGAAK